MPTPKILPAVSRSSEIHTNLVCLLVMCRKKIVRMHAPALPPIQGKYIINTCACRVNVIAYQCLAGMGVGISFTNNACKYVVLHFGSRPRSTTFSMCSLVLVFKGQRHPALFLSSTSWGKREPCLREGTYATSMSLRNRVLWA